MPQEKHILVSLAEITIFLALGYFIYLSHGWALGVAVGLIGILLISVIGMCQNIINRLSILYDMVDPRQRGE